ncbi:hypothetical protein H6P81_019388 [Aristolochia fimbriata]|uniref:Uncharacterized protein n=1 Tax=Aristolochia fimbriata TaxID=158543 RepID=A0AAV7DRK2_ARIFI|nr:hypothetical protein H6P81_019388 [Aristolochia fimbriata]
MKSKVVIITGASSGIGEKMTYQYAKRGSRLVLVARREIQISGVLYIYFTHYAIPHLIRSSNGRIIVTANSTIGVVPGPNLIIYNASKAALIHFYQTLRVELGSEVKFTIVTPGAMESEPRVKAKGKGLLKEGEMGIDEIGRDILLGPLPVEVGESAAARIVDEASVTGPGNDRSTTLSSRPCWCHSEEVLLPRIDPLCEDKARLNEPALVQR